MFISDLHRGRRDRSSWCYLSSQIDQRILSLQFSRELFGMSGRKILQLILESPRIRRRLSLSLVIAMEKLIMARLLWHYYFDTEVCQWIAL